MELWRYAARKSFGFSAENPTGTRNGGTRGKDCEKLRACIDIAPGETVTLAGSGRLRYGDAHLVYGIHGAQFRDALLLGRLRKAFRGSAGQRVFRVCV